MLPTKKQKTEESDLSWCINNHSTLSLESFATAFDYNNKTAANKRYASILRTKRFQTKVPNAQDFMSKFDTWRRSQSEVSFWNQQAIKHARQNAQAKTRLSVVGSVGHIGVQEAERLGLDEAESSKTALMQAACSATDTVLKVQAQETERCPRNNGLIHGYFEQLDLTKFKQEYEAMDQHLMWKLKCTGRYVEGVLYHFGCSLNYEHLCHSFVLDPWDPTYLSQSVFTKDELAEIKADKQHEIPQLDPDTGKYLDLYKEAKSATEARKIIASSQPWDKEFDRAKSHDKDWIRHSYYTMVRELERGGIDGSDKSETWLLAHIWTTVDRAFDDALLEVVRGESASLASSSRKNKDRLSQSQDKLERKKMGRRLDLILRRKRLEFGAGEAGKHTDTTDTKLLKERDLKLPKALKDMMMCLKKESGKRVISDLEVIGFLEYGLQLAMIRLDVPYKYVHRITRTQNVQVPADWASLPRLRKVLYVALVAKQIVIKTLSNVFSQDAYQEEGDDDDEQDTDLSLIMEPPKDDGYDLPDTFDSQ